MLHINDRYLLNQFCHKVLRTQIMNLSNGPLFFFGSLFIVCFYSAIPHLSPYLPHFSSHTRSSCSFSLSFLVPFICSSLFIFLVLPCSSLFLFLVLPCSFSLFFLIPSRHQSVLHIIDQWCLCYFFMYKVPSHPGFIL